MFILTVFLNLIYFIGVCIYLYILGFSVIKLFQISLDGKVSKKLYTSIYLISGLYFLSLLSTIFYFFYELNIVTSTLIIIISLIVIIINRNNLKPDKILFKEIRNFLILYFSKLNNFYLLLLFIPFLIYYLTMLSLPEITWDALAYHLPLMPNWNIAFLNDYNFYNALPKGLDVLFWTGYILTQGYFLPKFFHFIFFLILIFLISYVLRSYRFKIIWILSLLFLCNHWVTLEFAASTYIDFGNNSLEIFAFYFLYLFWIRKDSYYLIWMINCLLFAVSIKYTSLASSLILILIAIPIIITHRKRIKKFPFKHLNSLFLFSLLPILYYGKNLLFLKNPFWPFYLGHTGMSDSEYLRLTISNLNSFTFERTLNSYFLLPLRIFTGNFEAYNLKAINDFINNINFNSIEISIPFILISFFIYRHILYKKLFILGLIFLFLTFSFNFMFGSHQTRYILSSFLILSIYPSLFLSSSILFKHKYLINVILIFLILFIFQNKFNKIKYIYSYLRSNGNTEYLKNIHDFEPAIFMVEKGISSKSTIYPFQLNSLRYFKDYQYLSDAYSLGLGLTNDTESDLIILKNNSKTHWITNSQTSSWRKDWIKDPYCYDKNRLINLIKLDEYILKNGKILERSLDNYLIEIP